MEFAVLFGVVIVAAMVGAALGWRRGTHNIHFPPDKYDFRGGMTYREYLKVLDRKHRKRRLPLTIGWSAAAAGIAFAILLAIAVLRR